jgi:hypothetical protein
MVKVGPGFWEYEVDVFAVCIGFDELYDMVVFESLYILNVGTF